MGPTWDPSGADMNLVIWGPLLLWSARSGLPKCPHAARGKMDTEFRNSSRDYQALWVELNQHKCLSYICYTEICDSELSFHESKQTVPAMNAISSDFYEWILMWKKMYFPEIFVRHKCLVFFCVCTCTDLLVLNTEVKNLVYINSVAKGQINQCWFQSYIALINIVYL